MPADPFVHRVQPCNLGSIVGIDVCSHSRVSDPHLVYSLSSLDQLKEIRFSIKGSYFVCNIRLVGWRCQREYSGQYSVN